MKREQQSDEEDYLSDAFLVACEKQVQKDTLTYGEMRKKRLIEIEIKSRTKAPKVVAKESVEQGLAQPISSSNKGFQMLAKMGFKAGESLGKSKDGLREPIAIQLEQSRTGLGLISEENEKLNKLEEEMMNTQKVKVEDFVYRKRQEAEIRLIEKDIQTSRLAIQQLDMAAGIEAHDMWPVEDKGEEEPILDPFALENNPQSLPLLTSYLRQKHYYCIWCGFGYDSANDLDTDCPGQERNVHD